MARSISPAAAPCASARSSPPGSSAPTSTTCTAASRDFDGFLQPGLMHAGRGGCPAHRPEPEQPMGLLERQFPELALELCDLIRRRDAGRKPAIQDRVDSLPG